MNHIAAGQTADSVKKNKPITLNDSKSQAYSPTFYIVEEDFAKKRGMPLMGSNKFYIVENEESFPLQDLDTVYIAYNTKLGLHFLNFKFSKSSAQAIFRYAKKYQGKKVGLLLESQRFISVANILMPVNAGEMRLDGMYTKKGIEELRKEIMETVKKEKAEQKKK